MSAFRTADRFKEIDFQLIEQRLPTTATIVSHDGQTATITIPSYDGGVHHFGPITYITAAPLAAGDTVLVVKDENDSYWIIAP